MEKKNWRKCFGTNEFRTISRVCKACRDYLDCEKISGSVAMRLEEARRFAPLEVKAGRYVTSGMFARECREYRGPDRPKITLPPRMKKGSE